MRWKKVVSGILTFAMVLSSAVSAAPLSVSAADGDTSSGGGGISGQVTEEVVVASKDLYIKGWNANRNETYSGKRVLAVNNEHSADTTTYGCVSEGILMNEELNVSDPALTFLEFDLSELRSKASNFEGAKLRLYLAGHRNGGDFGSPDQAGHANKIKAAVVPSTVVTSLDDAETYNTLKTKLTDTAALFGLAGESQEFHFGDASTYSGQYNAAEYEGDGKEGKPLAGTCVEVDITDALQTAVNNTSQSNLILAVNETENKECYFVSKEGASYFTNANNADGSWAPSIVLTYPDSGSGNTPTNVALHKTVFASDTSVGSADKVTDGESPNGSDTYWQSGNLPTTDEKDEPQWLVIDLQAQKTTVESILVTSQAKGWSTNYEIQTSADGVQWLKIGEHACASGDTSPKTDTFTLNAAEGNPSLNNSELKRYVRFYFKAGNDNAGGMGKKIGIQEIQIMGTQEGEISSGDEVAVDTISIADVDSGSLDLALDDNTSKQLNVAFNPDGATNKIIKWISSDRSIATVSRDGLVTAQAAGTATITAKLAADETKTATVTVNVVETAVITHTVTFDANYSGAGVIPPQTIENNATVNKPDPDPERDGYTFTGWYEDAACTGTAVQFPYTVTAAKTFYAGWEKKKYSVTFNWNYTGAAPETTVVSDVEHNTTLENKTPTPPARQHFTFGGWYIEAACQTEYILTSPVTAEGLQLYAKWNPIQYTVTYVTNDENITIAPVTVNSGEMITAPELSGTKEGHTFGAWYEKKDLTGTPFNFTNTAIVKDTVLYAKWEPIDCIVTFVYNDDTTANTTETVKYGQAVTLPTPPSRDGYTPGGWFKEESYTNLYTSGDPITGPTTLYLKWISSANSATITFVTGDGATTIDKMTVVKGSVPSAPSNPTKTYYKFAGWYTDADCSEGNLFIFGTDTVSEDITLYAKWERIKCTVTFNMDGGTPTINPISNIDAGTKITEQKPSNPTKAGYVFAGWYKDNQKTELFNWDVDLVEQESTILYAKWTAVTLTVSPTTLALKKGETGTLTATVTPAGTPVEWSSSAEEIATVSQEGVVTAHSKGEADITADAAGKIVTVRVTVTEDTETNVPVITAPQISYTAPEADAYIMPADVLAKGADSVHHEAIHDWSENPAELVSKRADSGKTYTGENEPVIKYVDGVWALNDSLMASGNDGANAKFDLATTDGPIVITYKLYAKSFSNVGNGLGLVTKGDKQYASNMVADDTVSGVNLYSAEGQSWKTTHYKKAVYPHTEKWVDVIAVIDGSGKHRLYVGGEVGTHNDKVVCSVSKSSDKFAIGCQDTKNDRYFTYENGYLADVKFYSGKEMTDAVKGSIDLDALDSTYSSDKGYSYLVNLLSTLAPTANYTGTPYEVHTVWKSGSETLAAGAKFAADKDYTAVTTFTAHDGFAFSNTASFINAVKANVTAGNETAETNVKVAEDGQTMTVTVTYPHESGGEPDEITLDRTAFNLPVGAAVQLAVTPADANVTWTTNAAGTATVENGLVTAVAAGTAKITATAGTKKAEATVTVVEPANISLNKPTEDNGNADEGFVCSKAVDGKIDSDNRWVGKRDVSVEAPAILTIDLEKDETIFSAIKIYYDKKAFAQNYIIETSDSNSETSEWEKIADIEKGESNATNTIDALSVPNMLEIQYSGSDASTNPISVSKKEITSNLLKRYVRFRFTKKNSLTAPTAFSVSIQEIEIMGAQNGENQTPGDTTISLNKTSLTLEVGQEETLTATVTPSGTAVTWTSSDNTVASVDNGKVTAKKAGTATITATAGGKSATATVTVTEASTETTISLNKTSLTLEVGQEETLTATVTPSGTAVTWTSSDNTVASVDNGKVTAKKAGTATITATAGGKSATATVTVTDSGGDIVEVTGIELSLTSKTLTVGKAVTLKATITPANATNKDVTWKSSKESVATVDENGVVTAVAAGRANITATAEGGTDVNATARITVEEAEDTVPVTEITLNKDEIELTAAGATEQLEATVEPDDATNKEVTWKSSDENVATVDDEGLVTAVGNGTATITAEAKDGSGVKAEATVTVTIGGAAAAYTVTFNANGGTGAPAKVTVAGGKAVARPKAVPKRTGYTFKNWYTAAVGGAVYNFNSPVTKNLTLYAQWTQNMYKVSFNPVGGKPAPVAQTVPYGGFVKTPAAMTRTGYKFVGWYTDAVCTKAFNFKAKVTTNLTLYAKWTLDAQIKAGASQTLNGVEYSVEDPVKKTAIIKKADSKKVKKLKIKSTIVINGVTCTVVGIGKNAFKNCKKMTQLTIPATVTKIEKGAFQGCKQLKKLTIQGKALKTIKSGAFKGTPKGIKVTAKGFKKKQKTALQKKLKKAGMKSPKVK